MIEWKGRDTVDKTTISRSEKEYLCDLARRQKEYALSDKMQKKKEEWYLHNSLKGEKPMIVMEEETFWPDIRPDFVCRGEWAREIENQLLQNLYVAEEVKDDKVIPDFYRLEMQGEYDKYGIPLEKKYAKDKIGYHIESQLVDLERDLDKLKETKFFFNLDLYRKKEEFIQDVLQDILPVRRVNAYNYWNLSLTQDVVNLMGTENMFCAMIENPEEYHKMMEFISSEKIRLLRWQEENGLLYLNNGNDYMGGGSYCFTNELPTDDFEGKVRSIHTWGHINSQESVGISPSMFKEFVLPYMLKVSKEFGLLYYGCCEPVSDFWDDGVEMFENLRKVSISAWCDEKKMSEVLQGKKIIYSRKPSPNYLGVCREFDENAFREHIRGTLKLTKKCKKEIIFRDIYKLNGNKEKIRRAIEITREESENY